MRRSLVASSLMASFLLAPVTAHASPALGGLADEPPSLYDAQEESAEESDAQAQQPEELGSQSIPVTSSAPAAVSVDDTGDAVTVLGVSWDEVHGDAPATVEYRVLDESGAAGQWIELETLVGAGPDPDSAEAAGARVGTEPIIVGEGLDIEVRIDSGDAELEAITANVTAADEALADGAMAGAEDMVPRPSAPTAAEAQATAFSPGDSEIQVAAMSKNLTYTSRAQWGADDSLKKCEPDKTTVNKAMVVHHTAGATNYSKAQVPGILRGILKYHTQSLGWCDLGYNMLVDRYGSIYEGRSGGVETAVVGAHASGFNTGTFGVSVMGTYTSPAPQAAVLALAKIGGWQAGLWGYDPTSSVSLISGGGGSSKFPKDRVVTLPRIFGHRDTSSTLCPGAGLYGQLGQIRTRAKTHVPAHPTSGAIDTFYRNNASMTGVPTQKMTCGMTNGGCMQKFAKGVVHWSAKTGAHFTHAGSGIQNRWLSLAGEKGRLGYPTTEEFRLHGVSGSFAQNFQGGTITWSKATGSRLVVGGIGTKWKKLGWERGYLKLPTMDERCGLKNGGCYQKFQGGSIHWSSATGAHATKGAIQRAWGAQGYENGKLGYPTSDEYQSAGKTRQTYQGGTISWTASEGARVTYN